MPVRYLSRDELIVNRARGKRVLHLGCVGFADLDAETRFKFIHQSLHARLTNVAEVIGIDYSAKVIDRLRQDKLFGNIVWGDVERLSDVAISTTFDVVVAGDIIEHLSNPGQMLDGIHKFCTGGTEIIITTPNSMGLPNFIRYLGGRFREGDEHVTAFNVWGLSNLLVRHNYEVRETYTCFQKSTSRSKVVFPVGRTIFRMAPKLGGTLAVIAASRRAGVSSPTIVGARH